MQAIQRVLFRSKLFAPHLGAKDSFTYTALFFILGADTLLHILLIPYGQKTSNHKFIQSSQHKIWLRQKMCVMQSFVGNSKRNGMETVDICSKCVDICGTMTNIDMFPRQFTQIHMHLNGWSYFPLLCNCFAMQHYHIQMSQTTKYYARQKR